MGVAQEKGDTEDDEKQAFQIPLGLGMHGSSDKNCDAGLGWGIWLHEYHHEMVSRSDHGVPIQAQDIQELLTGHTCASGFEAPSSLHRHCPAAGTFWAKVTNSYKIIKASKYRDSQAD